MSDHASGKSKGGNYFTRQRGSWSDVIRIVVCVLVIKIFGILVGVIVSALIIFVAPKFFKSGKTKDRHETDEH